MPPWFESWYLTIAKEVHYKLGDPALALEWLQTHMTMTGQPGEPPDHWQDAIRHDLDQVPEPPLHHIPDHWNDIVKDDRVMNLLRGDEKLLTTKEATSIEFILSPLLQEQILPGPQALLVWKYFTGNMSSQEDHQLRHWVDAEPDHLEAFEKRFDLWDQLKSLPGMIQLDPARAWNKAYGLSIVPPEHSRRRSWRIPVILAGLLIGAIGLFSWTRDSQPVLVELSDTISGQLMSGDKIPSLIGNILEVEGSFQMLIAKTDSLMVFDGEIVFQPGLYHLHQSEYDCAIFVEKGSLTAFLGAEIFTAGAGITLRKQHDIWLKELE